MYTNNFLKTFLVFKIYKRDKLKNQNLNRKIELSNDKKISDDNNERIIKYKLNI